MDLWLPSAGPALYKFFPCHTTAQRDITEQYQRVLVKGNLLGERNGINSPQRYATDDLVFKFC